jgi:hypothetical protein
MKFILTESQEKLLNLRRRILSDEYLDHLYEIVIEGFDYSDPCEFDSFGEYLDEIISGSEQTFLNSYVEMSDYDKNTQNYLHVYVSDLIREKYFLRIEEEYLETECD